MLRLNLRRIAAAALLVTVVGLLVYPSLQLGVVTIKITDSGDKIGESFKMRLKETAIHRLNEGEVSSVSCMSPGRW